MNVIVGIAQLALGATAILSAAPTLANGGGAATSVATGQDERLAVVATFYKSYDAKAADRLGEVVAEDVVDHNAFPGSPGGLAGERQLLLAATVPFSDFRHERLVTEPVGEDQVLVVWRFTGRHTGDLLGVPATGKTVEFGGMDLLTVRSGKLVEHRHVEEVFQLLQQVQPGS